MTMFNSDNYMPESFTGKLAAVRQSHAMQGERRVVTMLFCDVKDSTHMAEQLDPEEWAEIMHEAFQHLVRPVYRYEGTVARLMGDALLAIFGAPIAHEDDPERAVLAALDILKQVQPFCGEVRDTYGMDFNVRVGINTGPVVVGEIGSDLAMEYTAMGDAANLAARMEQTAEPGSVQISEHTYKLIAPLFDVEPLGEIKVKGKGQPLRAFRVLGRKEVPGRMRGLAGLGSPLIGREKEMAALRGALCDMEAGRGGIVCLIGEAGLGKSRLIDEARRDRLAGSDDGGPWITGRGISYDRGRAYAVAQQVLRGLTGVLEGDSQVAAQAMIWRALEAVASEDREQVAAAVELLLGVGEQQELAKLEGEVLKRKLFAAVEVALAATAEENGLVLVLDDLHWADDASVELLLHLFRLTNSDPVLFLCAFRPYRHSSGWRVKLGAETDYPHRYQEIELDPLTEEDSSQLVSSLLEIADLPDSVRRIILRKAEGNPFFVEEVVRTLMEEGVLVRSEDGARWMAGKPAEDIVIPGNLQALLVSRIDRLEEEVRSTLQYAAVIGRSFYLQVLELVTQKGGHLYEHLNVLQRVGLMREVARVPEIEYAFCHELTRDAAYQTILRRQRRQFHRQVGEALERLYPTRLEEFASRLAHHFDQAGDAEKSLRYARIAGDAAARLYANVEAIEHYSRAIQLARKWGSAAEVLRHLYLNRGRTYEVSGRYDEALENYQELEAIGQEAGDLGLQLAALIPQVTIHAIPTARMDHVRGQELAEKALRLAEESGDPRAQSKALWNMMLLARFSGDNEKAREAGQRALAIAEEHDLPEETAYAAHDLAQVYMGDGALDKTLALQEQAGRIWRELGNLPMLADSLGGSAFALLERGEYERALQNGEEASAVSESIDNQWGLGYSRMVLGLVHAEMGHISESVRAMKEAEEIGKRGNFIAASVIVPAILAWLYASFGQTEGGFALLERASEGASRVQIYRARVMWFQAWLYMKTGEFEKSVERMERAQESLEQELRDPYFGPLIAYLQVAVLEGIGKLREALDLTQRNLQAMAAGGLQLFKPDLLVLEAKAQMGLGRPEEAWDSLHAALDAAEEIGSMRGMLQALPPLLELSPQLGNEGQTARLARKAADLMQFMSDNIEEPSLRESFLNLPEVKLMRGALEPNGK
jgi:predicted ATPase/class 3 adenylate cyclase